MSRHFDLNKQQLWLRRVQRWQRSQLTIRDYCARHHLSEPSFYGWKRVLAQRGLLAPVGAAAPAPRANMANTVVNPTTPLFVAATLADTVSATPSLEIVLPDGLCVRVAAGFDAVTLRRLLDLLRGESC